jgi:hypothetical protein
LFGGKSVGIDTSKFGAINNRERQCCRATLQDNYAPLPYRWPCLQKVLRVYEPRSKEIANVVASPRPLPTEIVPPCNSTIDLAPQWCLSWELPKGHVSLLSPLIKNQIFFFDVFGRPSCCFANHLWTTCITTPVIVGLLVFLRVRQVTKPAEQLSLGVATNYGAALFSSLLAAPARQPMRLKADALRVAGIVPFSAH